MKKKNILFISHDSSLGGAQRSLLDLVLNLDKERFSVTVLVTLYGPLSEELDKHGVRVFQTHFAWWASKSRNCSVFRRFGENIKALFVVWRKGWLADIDLIYTNTSVVPLGGLLAWVFNLPHVWHVREFAIEEHDELKFDGSFPLSARFINKSSSLVVFNSDAVNVKYTKFVESEKRKTVYNGVVESTDESPFFTGKTIAQSEKFTICIVGTVSQNKGQLLAVEALKILVEKGNCDAILHIVGTGPDEDVAKVVSLAKELGVKQRVILEGYRNDVNKVFSSADVCWVCSRAEAFGRVIVESMAAGTPVLASDTGGIPEVIVDGVTGILFPTGDAEALAQKTIDLIRDAEKYRNLSREAYYAAYKRFNKERYVSEMMTAMSTVLS